MCTTNLNCEVCHKIKKNTTSKTCSRECANILKRKNSYEERKCVECGNVFTVRKKVNKKLCSDICRKTWGLREENKQERLKKSENSVYAQYGVKTTLKLKTVIDKSKKTKKEKYGDENYNNNIKSKKTKKEKYNDENYNNRELAKKTSLEKHGSEFSIQLDHFKKKRKETNNKIYDTDYPTQNKEIKNKIKETNIKKYGVPFQSQSKETKHKITKTWNDRIEKTKSYTLYKSLINVNLELLGVFSGITNASYDLNLPSYKEYNFKCLTCNNKFIATFANYCLPSCKKCNPPNKSSKIQNIIRTFLNNNNINFLENYRYAIKKLELDFYIPDFKIAIEVNGNYFHSERAGKKDKNYHLQKTIMCEKENIKLIHIFEDELLLKTDIVLSKLSYLLKLTSKSNKVYARKCEIKELNNVDKKMFLEQNHLQGNCVSTVNIGLFYNKKLFSIATFSKNRISLGAKTNKDNWELTRFCNLLEHSVPGGFSKLLNYFILKYNPNNLISYCEIRYSGIKNEDNMYIKNGFELLHITKPGYWYFIKGNYIKRYHRFNFRKNKIEKIAKLKNLDTKNLTEWEIAQNLDMDRIWDCGQLKYSLTIKKKEDN